MASRLVLVLGDLFIPDRAPVRDATKQPSRLQTNSSEGHTCESTKQLDLSILKLR